jgi:hypothetical protein
VGISEVEGVRTSTPDPSDQRPTTPSQRVSGHRNRIRYGNTRGVHADREKGYLEVALGLG